MPVALEGEGWRGEVVAPTCDVHIEEVVCREGEAKALADPFTHRGIYPPLTLHLVESIQESTVVGHTEVY